MKIIFEQTVAYSKITKFLYNVNKNVKTEKQAYNKNIKQLMDDIRKLSNDTPLSNEPQRYGNIAFSTFYEKLKGKLQQIVTKNKLDTKNKQSMEYLLASFGNPVRIDFGTGHELNFFCYLYCLVVDGVIAISECAKSLDVYLDLSREIILKYNLESAGSHGVWGIDDYHLLIYVFGSAELFYSDCTFEDLFDKKNSELLYAKALLFCQMHKTRNRYTDFEIHSPMLYELRNKSWMIINVEIMQIYEKDVIKSNAVNQHFIETGYLLLEIDQRYLSE